jgi:cell cycle checkpoint protein
MSNSGKGDPPGSSANAKDLKREKELDALLKDPIKLPSHLQHHERRASRVDVDVST